MITTRPAANLLCTRCADGSCVWTGWANGHVVTWVERHSMPWQEVTVVPFTYPTWFGVALADRDGYWRAAQYSQR